MKNRWVNCRAKKSSNRAKRIKKGKSCQASIYKRKQRPQQPAAVCHDFHNVPKVTNSSSSSRYSAHANENRPCSVCSDPAEHGFKQITSAARNSFHVVRNGSKRTCEITKIFAKLSSLSALTATLWLIFVSVGEFILFRGNCSSLTYWRLWEYRNVQILDGFI